MPKVIWGINPVLEALKSSPELIEEVWIENKNLFGKKYQIIERAKKLEISLKLVPSEKFKPPKIPPQINTQGVVAYLSEFIYHSLEEIVENWKRRGEVPIVLLLDEIEDPQNLGSIIRSADAGGVHGIVIPKRRSCEVTGTVIKISSGSTFNLPIAKVTNLKHAITFFKERGLWIVALTPHAKNSIYEVDLTQPLVLVVGNEQRGIRKSNLELCDLWVQIPMRGKIESLNVAVATAVAIFETLRQRFYSEKTTS